MAHVINEYAPIYAGSLSTNLPVLTSKVTVIVLGHKGVHTYCMPCDSAWLAFELCTACKTKPSPAAGESLAC